MNRPGRAFIAGHRGLVGSAIMRRLEREGARNVLVAGTGEDISIREVAEIMREAVYPDANLVFDRSKPDGQPLRRVDVTRLHALGWRHRIGLREGITTTYDWFLRHQNDARMGRTATIS